LVLVSEAMPQNKTRFFYENGVWICHFPDIKPLILVLRRTMIEINKLKITQQGSNTKMELLYNYLTSNEFHGQLESIILGFQDLQKSYLDEKLKMQKIWKEREKQFDRILSNAVNFYGSLKGIAGASIQDISMLESPDNLLSD